MAPKEGTALFFTLFLCSLMVFSEPVDDSQPIKYPYSFDHFQFELQWPPSICSNLTVECAISYEKRFIIGAFKPINPFRCYGSPFSMAKIEDIKPQLSKVWYDLVHGKDENLWKEAWNKHGVCAEEQFDEAYYFELALNIKNNQNYNVLYVVQSVGITPKESNPLWKLSRFFHAIYWRLGKAPKLICNTNKYTKKAQLAKVVLCFADDGIKLINCKGRGNCPREFTWPTNANPPPPPPPPSLPPPPPSPTRVLSINN